MAAAVAANSNTEKRCAVVTGGNKGIGYGICEQLASEGIVVVLTARDEKRGLDALKKLKDTGFSDNVLFHQLDVADSSSVVSLAQFIDEKFGKLDILVNNAGVGGVFVDVDAFRASVAGGGVADFQKHMIQDCESVAECMQINYYGAKRMIEVFIPLLQKSQSRRIVNVSSSTGQFKYLPDGQIKEILADADNLTEEKVDQVIDEFLKDFKEDSLESKGWTTSWPGYAISKAANNAYTRIIAKKYPNFKINCVCPGYVKTDLNNHTGVLTVEDGASRIVRLALLPEDGPSGLFFSNNEVASF